MASVLDDSELAGVLGPAAARALRGWADATGRSVALTRRRWKASGYTGAVLTTVTVGEPGRPPSKVVLKVCPPGRYAAESAAHRRAMADSPSTFARAHLVGQAYDPYPVDDGGLLMFQQVATGSLLELMPLDSLDGDDLAQACRHVVTGVAVRWNPADRRTAVRTAPEYLRQELGDVADGGGTLARWATGNRIDSGPAAPPWLAFPGRPQRLPNPLLLHRPDSLLAGIEIDILTGRAHGDLHSQNVLIPRERQRLRPDRYQLVDLSTYAPDAPLTRDPATLLLSLLAPRLALLGAPARLALVDYLSTPDSDRGPLPGEVLAVVDAVTTAADREVRRHGWADEWRAQFLLSLVATGLMFVTYARLPAEDRWWYFTLSARAAHQFLGMHGAEPPDLALDPGSPIRTPATEPPSKGGVAAGPATTTMPVAAAVPVLGPAPAPGGPREAVSRLVEMLLDCAAMESGPRRELVVSGLPRNVRTAISRYPGARADVLSIVRTCQRFPDGLRDLLAAVRVVEVGTIAAGRLEEMAEDLLRSIESGTG